MAVSIPIQHAYESRNGGPGRRTQIAEYTNRIQPLIERASPWRFLTRAAKLSKKSLNDSQLMVRRAAMLGNVGQPLDLRRARWEQRLWRRFDLVNTRERSFFHPQ